MDKQLETYIDKLSKMIACETISSCEDITKFNNFQALLKGLFPHVFSTFNLELFDGSMLLSYIVENTSPILLMSHQDVVESNGKWIHDPFSPYFDKDNNKLYGRGTLDTKGYLFAILQSLEELLLEGYNFTHSIFIASSNNEETSQLGARNIANTLHSRNIHFDFVLDEGGFIVDNPLASNASNNKMALVALGEKACIEVKFFYKGSGGHASTPEDNEPLVRLSSFILDAKKHNHYITYLPDVTIEMLSRASTSMHGVKRFLFRHARSYKCLLTPILKKLSPVTKAMVSTSICFTRICGSEANNVIPTCPYVVANIRASHKEGKDNALNKIIKIAHKYGLDYEILDPGVESKISDFTSKEFKYLSKCIKKTFGNEVIVSPYIANGASDSKYMDLVSDNVFRFAPFIVSNEQIETVHGLEENIDVSNLEKGVNFLKNLIKGY